MSNQGQGQAQSQGQGYEDLGKAIKELLEKVRASREEVALYEAIADALTVADGGWAGSFEFPATVRVYQKNSVVIATPYGEVRVGKDETITGKDLEDRIVDLLSSPRTLSQFLTSVVKPIADKLSELEIEAKNLRERLAGCREDDDWDP